MAASQKANGAFHTYWTSCVSYPLAGMKHHSAFHTSVFDTVFGALLCEPFEACDPAIRLPLPSSANSEKF